VTNGNLCKVFSIIFLNAKLKTTHRPAYIAGVTNPIFESSRQWDLFLDISTGNVTVAKDIHLNYPATSTIGIGAPLITRSGTLKAESSMGSEDDITRMAKDRTDPSKDNNADKIFIDDVSSSLKVCVPSVLILVSSDPRCHRRPLWGKPRSYAIYGICHTIRPTSIAI